MHALKACGYEVRLACAANGPEFQSILSDFDPVELAFPRSVDPIAMARAGRRLVHIVNEIQPAVVHLHTPAAAMPARIIPRALLPRGTRVIYTVHGFAHVWDGGGWRDRVLELVERVLAARTDLLLFQSREDLEQTQQRGYRTALRYLGNGVEDTWFSIPPRAVPRRPFELLFVGRLIREKGALDLLEGLASVPDARLTVVGTELPSERDGVEAAMRRRVEADDLTGRVHFLGAVAKSDMPAVVANSDALVLPSYREGVPRSLIEGFAAGRPAVATDVRGCRELVEDSVTGFLVPPRRPDLLAAALRRMVALPADKYRAMSDAAAALAAEQYKESAVFGRLLAAYAEIGVPPRHSVSLSSPIVGDDLSVGHLGVGASAEEEQGGGSVHGVRGINMTVEEAQPEQAGAGEEPRLSGASQTSDKVVEAPEQLGARAGSWPGVDLGEPPEQVAMPAGSEAREVVRARVDLLHERRLGVDQPGLSENPMDLLDYRHRREYVLEDRLHDDSVDTPRGEGDGVRVGNQLGDVAAVQVESDHLDLVPASVEAVETVADRAAPDDQHPTGPVGEHFQHPGNALFGDPVERLPDASQ
jgi:glycosyltransferase involved in cell wall biosynthesis